MITMVKHTPTEIKLLQKPRQLSITFDTGETFVISCTELRANSPSAAAKKENHENFNAVNIIGIDPVGNYAVKLVFDDGHDTGIYSWDLLYQIGSKCS